MKQPLAIILRPKSINEIIGQQHLFNENSVLDRMVKTKSLYSLIFYGVPGIGKTSIALALANDIGVPHMIYNAVVDKKEQLISIIDLAKRSDNGYVVILEEVHRLNRDKQDILLPYLENGTVYIFATTTENPYFTINPAIRSRCQIFELTSLSKEDVFIGLKKRLATVKLNTKINDDVIKMIAEQTNGDLRAAINIVDMLNTLYAGETINKTVLKDVMQQSYTLSADYGDEFYDIKSAMHKSLRGSDPNAAIYYLARLLASGDIESLCRRLIAMAYEDIGLANPQLCSRVIAACDAAKEVGFPECKQIFAAIVIEMCLSPKSNSAYLAIVEALDDIKNGKVYQIPKHIKDQSYKSASKLGRTGYKYPHDYKNAYVKQQYLPNELKDKQYYKVNTNNPIEPKMNEYLKQIKEEK
ncbi:MAG: replication-associated recombination protein A [Mycoplasmataceae bacterium]|jgi:putative ATPase|nr:replication-associated recombination protein A [Mycoplasmataceae bacterium]